MAGSTEELAVHAWNDVVHLCISDVVRGRNPFPVFWMATCVAALSGSTCFPVAENAGIAVMRKMLNILSGSTMGMLKNAIRLVPFDGIRF